MDCTPSLLGVGFIIGPNIAALMFAGGITGWYVMIPLIEMLSSSVTIFPATHALNTLSADDIWSNYIRYIGAGCVAFGGLLSLIKILPLLKTTLISGFQELFAQFELKDIRLRTDQDISLRWLIIGSLLV